MFWKDEAPHKWWEIKVASGLGSKECWMLSWTSDSLCEGRRGVEFEYWELAK